VLKGLWSNTHTYKTFTHSFTNTHFLVEGRGALLLPVVAELDGGAVEDAAEGDRLNFPVRHRVAEQADARVHGLLGVEARRTEVTCSHSSNLVDMEVDHLDVLMVGQARRNAGQSVIVEVQLSQVGGVSQCAIFHRADLIVAQTQLSQVLQAPEAISCNLGDLVSIQVELGERDGQTFGDLCDVSVCNANVRDSFQVTKSFGFDSCALQRVGPELHDDDMGHALEGGLLDLGDLVLVDAQLLQTLGHVGGHVL